MTGPQRKGHPLLLPLACDRLGVDADETVLLDDTQANVESARSVGLAAILFVDNHQTTTDLEGILRWGAQPSKQEG